MYSYELFFYDGRRGMVNGHSFREACEKQHIDPATVRDYIAIYDD